MFSNLRVLTQVVLALLMFAPVAFSQALSDRVGVEYSVQPEPHLMIMNKYSYPITGLLVLIDEMQRAHFRAVMAFDPSTNDKDYEAIPANKSRAVKVARLSAVDLGTIHPEVKAVIFGDGSSAGEPSWVEELRMRRQCAFDELVTVEKALTDAKKYFVDNNTIVASLKERQSFIITAFVGNPATHTAECQGVAHQVNSLAIGNLLRAGVDGEVGNPQKTIPVVLRMLDRWRARLAGVGVGAQANAPRP